MSARISPFDRLRELGGDLYLDGERLRYRIPADSPEARELLADLRRNRDAIMTLLREQKNAPLAILRKASLERGATEPETETRSLVREELPQTKPEQVPDNQSRHTRLYQYLFREVMTPEGIGILEQVFSDRVCVRIDGKPSRPDKPTETLYYFPPDEISPPEIM
jgi:hypothetical protein